MSDLTLYPADIAAMSRIVEDGLRAGALGFSSSRTVLHKSIDGELVPGTTATARELIGIGRAKELSLTGNFLDAETARAIHYGEEADRIIHGETSADEAKALLEEGVQVAPLLFPVVPPSAKN